MWFVLAAVWSIFVMVVVGYLTWRLVPSRSVMAPAPAPEPAPRDALASRMRERVVVTCKDGASFVGLLYESDARSLVLRDAAAVGAGENRTDLPLDGELVLLLADVSYLQRAWVEGGGAWLSS